MTKLVTVISDTHINSTIGLCNNPIVLADGGSYSPSFGQKWLAEQWKDFWQESSTFLDNESVTEKILILNGDIVDLNTHSQHQLITPNESTIVKIAYDMLSPICEKYDTVYFIKGTEAHVKQSGELEELLGVMLHTKTNETTGEHTHWRLNLNVDDVLFNIEHHGKVGTKDWTKLTPLMNLGVEHMLDAARFGYQAPDLVIRSHMHTFGDTTDNLPTRVIQNSAWQLATAFSRRIGIIRPADIGGLNIICNKGEYDVNVFKRNPSHAGYIKH